MHLTCLVLVAGEEMRCGCCTLGLTPPRPFSYCYWLLSLSIKLRYLVNTLHSLHIEPHSTKGDGEQSIQSPSPIRSSFLKSNDLERNEWEGPDWHSGIQLSFAVGV